MSKRKVYGHTAHNEIAEKVFLHKKLSKIRAILSIFRLFLAKKGRLFLLKLVFLQSQKDCICTPLKRLGYVRLGHGFAIPTPHSATVLQPCKLTVCLFGLPNRHEQLERYAK
jgi:hypothetical protein